MRNLKRALSLALATVMTLGLMVVGTGAVGYTDVTSEDNQEAIEVLQAVGIMTGVTDDEFNPDGLVTRNQIAVIMSNLLNLDYDYYRGINPFTDVPAWAAPYVAACAAEGVVAGIGGGLYGGENNVTAAQAALMIMKALGYFQYQDDFTPDWQVATIRQASQIGLFSGVDSNAEEALTRGQVAQMVLNGLQKDMVEFTGDVGTQITIGDTTVNSGYRPEYTSLTSSDDKYNTLVSGNTDINDQNGQYYIQLGEELYDGDLTKHEVSDDFGRPSTQWTYDREEIGTYANQDDLVGTYTAKVTKSAAYTAVGKNVYDDLCDGESTLTVYFDGVRNVVDADNIDLYIERNNSGASNSTANGDLTEIYVDSNNDVTIVTARTYVFQAAGDYDEKKETVSLTTDSTKYDTAITLDNRTLEAEDFPAIVDLVADDYVLVTAIQLNNGRYEVKSVAPAEVVTGTVEGYKAGSNVTMGGNKYEFSATATAAGIKDIDYNVGRDATLVLDSYDYIIAVDESVVLTDYVYITEFGSSSGMTTTSRALANATFPDGTTDEIVVDEAYDKVNDRQETSKSTIASWDTTQTSNLGWFTYSVNSADEYTLYPIESKYSEEIASYTYAGPADLVVSSNSVVKPFANDAAAGHDADDTLANDETIVLVKDRNDDVTVYTGVKNFPAISLTGGGSANVTVVERNSNGYAALVYIELTGPATISGEQETNLVYVLSYDGRYVTTDNETYYQYTVLDGEDEVDVVADRQIQGRTGDVYQVANYLTRNNDEQLTDFALVSSSSGSVIGGTGVGTAISQSAGTINVGGVNYLVTEDTAITLVTPGDYASIMNKDEDAEYEVDANISAKDLVNALKGYDYTYDFGGKTSDNGRVLEELYVTIKSATEADDDVAEVGTITFGGVTSTGYNTIAQALANATDVTSGIYAGVSVTGSTGTLSYEIWDNAAIGDTTEADLDAGSTNATGLGNINGWMLASTNTMYVLKVTATSVDGTATDVKYVAVNPVTMFTVKIDNNNAASIRVTMGSETKIVAAGTEYTFTAKVAEGSNFNVSYEVDNDGTTSASVTGATNAGAFGGVVTVEDVTGNVEITFA